MLREMFDDWSRQRHDQEQQWLKDLRQYKGVYDPEIKFRKGASKAFIRVTRSKVRAIDAHVGNMLFPSSDRNWGIESTPVVEVDPALHQQAIQQIAMQTGQMPDEDTLLEAINRVAKDRAEKMADEIEDQLTEGRYEEVCRLVLHSGHQFGTGILKGPSVERRHARKWTEANGSYQLADNEVLRPYFCHVPIWRWYPDPYATSLDDCEGSFEEHVMSKHELRQLAKRKDFDAQAIYAYIKEHPKGDAKPQSYQQELSDLETRKPQSPDRYNKYHPLEYWGVVDGQMLADCGCEIAPGMENMELEANVWVLGNTIIKAVMNPTEQQQRPYHLYYYEKDETSIWGNSAPSIAADGQQGYNASIRMAMDNGAQSAGPQIEINRELLLEEQDLTAIVPNRVWIRGGTAQEANAPAIRLYTVESRVSQYLELADRFKGYIDEVLNVPSYMSGGERTVGAARTKGGLSMLMGNASMSMRELVKNFDDGVTTPFITALYHWNMQFNDKDSIKGDYAVIARGTTSLIAKEVRAEALERFAAGTANPLDAPFVDRQNLLRDRANALDLADKVIDPEAA